VEEQTDLRLKLSGNYRNSHIIEGYAEENQRNLKAHMQQHQQQIKKKKFCCLVMRTV